LEQQLVERLARFVHSGMADQVVAGIAHPPET
jgi:hypothetical protein